MEAICSVSLDAIAANYNYFQQRAHPARVIPVVKADAYGHGAIEVTQHLHQEWGVNLFAVATLREAKELSHVFPNLHILIFSRVFASELHQLPPKSILTISSMDDARSLAASGHSELHTHLNVNTGMNRLGVTPEQAVKLIFEQNPGFQIDGVYSHFSSSDTLSTETYRKQKQIFMTFISRIKKLGYKGIIHFANSAAALKENTEYFDAIRLGIGLYGYDLSADEKAQQILRPAMEIKAPLIRVEQINAGESVSYAEQWRAAIDTNIGTLRIGYADGYRRSLGNRGHVANGNKVYPVIGTVTMDHIMIDLGDDEPPSGTYFTVLGGSNHAQIKISRVSDLLQTIPYEICCGISPRVIRQY